MKTYQEYETITHEKKPLLIKELIRHNSQGRIHWHEAIEILYFTNGKALTMCNLQEHHVKKGTIVVINGNELHTGIISQINSKFYCLQINPNFFHNLIGKDYIVFQNIIEDEDCAKLLEILIELEKAPDSPQRYLESMRVISELFLLLTSRYVKKVLCEENYAKEFKKLNLFRHIIDHINRHYMEDLNVSILAEQFHMSASYFAHFFKKNAQKSVIEYVNEIRILYAKLFLEKEDCAISEIALRVGFSDINYFSRKFKAIAGVSPTEYKKQLQIKE